MIRIQRQIRPRARSCARSLDCTRTETVRTRMASPLPRWGLTTSPSSSTVRPRTSNSMRREIAIPWRLNRVPLESNLRQGGRGRVESRQRRRGLQLRSWSDTPVGWEWSARVPRCAENVLSGLNPGARPGCPPRPGIGIGTSATNRSGRVRGHRPTTDLRRIRPIKRGVAGVVVAGRVGLLRAAESGNGRKIRVIYGRVPPSVKKARAACQRKWSDSPVSAPAAFPEPQAIPPAIYALEVGEAGQEIWRLNHRSVTRRTHEARGGRADPFDRFAAKRRLLHVDARSQVFRHSVLFVDRSTCVAASFVSGIRRPPSSASGETAPGFVAVCAVAAQRPTGIRVEINLRFGSPSFVVQASACLSVRPGMVGSESHRPIERPAPEVSGLGS